MITCPSCRSANHEGATGCFTCGQPLPTTPTIREGSVIASRYEVLRPLGSGGMGIVYQARDRVLDEVVAIKILRADIAQEGDVARRFRSEIKLARKVTHRNVCRIHEYGEEGGLRYISMEFVDGVDLKRILRQTGGLLPQEAFAVSLQVALGLEAIHEAGIVHRDLKTPNIMRDARGVVRLMDFGIAKKVEGEATLGATAAGLIVGTPEYMSPEQARGERVDFRSDIYALGIVVYEIFTEKVPFRGDTPLATILKHLHDPPPLEGPDAASFPESLVSLLQKSLAKNPADRHQSAHEMVEALYTARALAFPGAAPPAAILTPAGAGEIPRSSTPLPTPTPLALTPPPVTSVPPPTRIAAGEGTDLASAAPTRTGPPPTVPAPARRRSRVERPARTSRTLFVALPAIAVAAAVVWLVQRSGSAPEPSTAPPAAPPSTLSSFPEPTRSVAPSPVVVTTPPPATPPPLTAPPSTVRVRPTPAPPVVTPVAAAPTPAPTPVVPPSPARPADAPSGFLQLVVVPWAEVSIDAAAVGRVTSSKLPLRPGAHTVRFAHPDYQPLQRKVTILPGETLKLVVDLAEDAIRKKP